MFTPKRTFGTRVLILALMGWGLTACAQNPSPSHYTLADIKGLNSTEVHGNFGKPNFTRRDSPAEIWQYRNNICILDLFLYPEENKGQTVTHCAIRSANNTSEETCLKSFSGLAYP